jgi:hypothetical protein
MTLITAVEKIVGKKFNISEDSLAQTYTPAIHSTAKAEAL